MVGSVRWRCRAAGLALFCACAFVWPRAHAFSFVARVNAVHGDARQRVAATLQGASRCAECDCGGGCDCGCGCASVKSSPAAMSRREILKYVGLLSASLHGSAAMAQEQGQSGGAMFAADVIDTLKTELFGVANDFEPLPASEKDKLVQDLAAITGTQTTYLALGCYWGAEAAFRCMPGIVSTRVGFMGGKIPNPTYERIGDHLEAVEVVYTGGIETYLRLLKRSSTLYDLVDFGHRYERALFPQGGLELEAAKQIDAPWSNIPVVPQGGSFYEAKLSHQAWSTPQCRLAAPNSALISAGLKRVKDHPHYSQECPMCAVQKRS